MRAERLILQCLAQEKLTSPGLYDSGRDSVTQMTGTYVTFKFSYKFDTPHGLYDSGWDSVTAFTSLLSREFCAVLYVKYD